MEKESPIIRGGLVSTAKFARSLEVSDARLIAAKSSLWEAFLMRPRSAHKRSTFGAALPLPIPLVFVTTCLVVLTSNG
jgi:hypothetical protein